MAGLKANLLNVKTLRQEFTRCAKCISEKNHEGHLTTQKKIKELARKFKEEMVSLYNEGFIVRDENEQQGICKIGPVGWSKLMAHLSQVFLANVSFQTPTEKNTCVFAGKKAQYNIEIHLVDDGKVVIDNVEPWKPVHDLFLSSESEEEEEEEAVKEKPPKEEPPKEKKTVKFKDEPDLVSTLVFDTPSPLSPSVMEWGHCFDGGNLLPEPADPTPLFTFFENVMAGNTSTLPEAPSDPTMSVTTSSDDGCATTLPSSSVGEVKRPKKAAAGKKGKKRGVEDDSDQQDETSTSEASDIVWYTVDATDVKPIELISSDPNAKSTCMMGYTGLCHLMHGFDIKGHEHESFRNLVSNRCQDEVRPLDKKVREGYKQALAYLNFVNQGLQRIVNNIDWMHVHTLENGKVDLACRGCACHCPAASQKVKMGVGRPSKQQQQL